MGAAEDRDVKVIVLKANGKHFSAGHDMSGSDEALSGNGEKKSAAGLDWKERGLQAIYEWETIHYLGYSRQWRDVPKPSIAAVQGQCIAGGLMLCWPCDLIVAADNAKFSDPVVRMGIGGVEYHAHTWEVGPRKAKEMLFTAQSFSAEEAERLGMVNRVVPLDDLVDETMALARQIAEMHPFALAQAKRAVNQTMDVQGFYTALQSVFDIHQTGHGNAMTVGGYPVLVALDQMKKTNE
jgi:enoyl-CoA hydratase/carnithine racemase